MEPDECALAEARSEFRAIGKGESERGGVCAERIIGADGIFALVVDGLGRALVDIAAPIIPGPAIEAAELHAGQIIRHEIGTDHVALVDDCP